MIKNTFGDLANKIFAFGQAIPAASDGVLRSTLHGSQNEPDAKIGKRNDAGIGVLNPEKNKTIWNVY